MKRSAAGTPVDEAVHQRIDVVEQAGEVGREVAQVAQRRREIGGRLAKVAHQRVGVDGEALQPLHRGAGLAQEGGQDPERVGQLLVARRERAEGPLAVHDQAAELPVAGGDRIQHAAGVAHQAPQGELLLVQRSQEVGARLEEGRSVAERAVEVAPVVAREGDPRLAQPGLEVPARAAVEHPEDLVELHRVRDLRVGQAAPVGKVADPRHRRAKARRRSRRAGSSGAGSRGCRPSAAHSAGRSPSARWCAACRRRAPCPCTIPIFTPAMRTSASSTSSDASGNAASAR